MMATITISNSTYEKRMRRAAETGTSVEAIAESSLDNLAECEQGATPESSHRDDGARLAAKQDLPFSEWKTRSDEWMAVVAARADRYPPGFEADCGYEAICGDR